MTQRPPRRKLKNMYKNAKYPAPNKVTFAMSSIQLKTARHLKKQGNAAHSEVMKQPIKMEPQLPGWGAQLVGALSSLLA